MDKSEIAKSVLRNILVVEQAVQGRELSVSRMNLSYVIPQQLYSLSFMSLDDPIHDTDIRINERNGRYGTVHQRIWHASL